MPSPFTVRPLGPAIGAEVLDLDLADVSLPETLEAIEAALVKHEALVLHVPELTPEQHLAIAKHFGESEVHTFYPNLGEGYEQITLIDSKLGDRADMWHHDESFLPSAPIVTMTQAKILPPLRWRHLLDQHDDGLRRAVRTDEAVPRWPRSLARHERPDDDGPAPERRDA